MMECNVEKKEYIRQNSSIWILGRLCIKAITKYTESE